MFNYWGFGLRILSEIEFPELLSCEFSVPDVVIKYGITPETITGIQLTKKGFFYKIDEQALLFKVTNVANYYAFGGHTVVVEPCVEQEMRTIRLYILATVMAGILTQRKLLPFHASAIIRNEALILIAGESQAGKSTTLAGLIKRGFNIFGDDVLVLKKDEDQMVLASASYPMIKLWDDTIEKLNDDTFRDRSFRIKYDLEKFGIFFHKQFNKDQYPLKKIYIIKKKDIPDVSIKTLSGINAFEALRSHIYRPILLQSNTMLSRSFTILTELSKSAVILEVSRPLVCNPEDLINHIEASILQ
ncbi:hypothetical protein [Emticicia fluvialis]|uniref:hypothetical protein n=1 Tax=Emticicia fluvialis TaxID=2974474 RepID=UPI00216552A8|nr:hypothetical protein [Emticicia fluvialis]